MVTTTPKSHPATQIMKQMAKIIPIIGIIANIAKIIFAVNKRIAKNANVKAKQTPCILQ